MHEFFWKHDLPIKLFLLLGFISLTGYVVYISRQNFYSPVSVSKEQTNYIDTCGEDCKETIDEIVSEAVSTLSAKVTTANTVITKASQSQIVTYIPMSTTFSTRNTDWVDVKGSEAYINLAEYAKNPYIDWDASVKVQHGSGKGTVRLYDITNSIAVDGSTLETDSSEYTQLSSGRLNFWAGRNLYTIQVKSIGGGEVYVTSGRVKIVSK